MQTRHRIILGAISLGLLIWILDATVDRFVFNQQNVRNLLIFGIFVHEFYMRLLILCFFLVFGVIMSQVVDKHAQAEHALRESETRYRELFDNMSSGVAVYQSQDDGQNFIFVDFNRTAEKIEKTSKQELIGKSVLKVFPGVREFGLFEVFQRVWKTGQPEQHPIS